MSLRIRRGTEIQRKATLFDLGEIVYTTDTKQLFIGDGVTAGGKNVVENCDGIGLQWNSVSQKLDIDGTGLTTENISESGDNLYFKTYRTRDAAAALFTPNIGHTGISFLYDDTTGKIYATVTSAGGLAALIDDGTPRLGGNLVLNTYDITGTGDINITGGISATTISASLGGNLVLNTHDITGTGDINITGGISATTISASLGGNLVLNTHDITGVGDIGIIGSISSTTYGGDALTIDGPVITSSTGLVDIGTTSNPQGVVITGSTYDVNLEIISTTTTGDGPTIALSGVKGTLASPVPLVTGDSAGQLRFQAYQDTPLGPAIAILGAINMSVDVGGDTTSILPRGKLQFLVANGPDINNAAKAEFNKDGVFSAPIIKVGQVNGTLPALAEAGMIVLDGTTFKGYDGSTWVVLGLP